MGRKRDGLPAMPSMAVQLTGALQDEGLTPTAIYLLLFLVERGNSRSGWSHWTQSKMAVELRRSRKSVNQALRQLRERGLVRVQARFRDHGRGRLANRVKVMAGALVQRWRAARMRCAKRRRTNVTMPRHHEKTQLTPAVSVQPPSSKRPAERPTRSPPGFDPPLTAGVAGRAALATLQKRFGKEG